MNVYKNEKLPNSIKNGQSANFNDRETLSYLATFKIGPGERDSKQEMNACIYPIAKQFDWKTLLVTGGVNDENQLVSRTEMIDLINDRRCNRKQIPNYPFGVSGSVSGLVYDRSSSSSEERIVAVVCGGVAESGEATAACHALNIDQRRWEGVANLTEARTEASVTSLPVENSSIPEGLFVAGGKSNRRLFNSDLVTFPGLGSKNWKKYLILPRAVHAHCMVTVNSTTLLLIGGRTHAGPIKETVFYDMVHQKWQSGPEMKTSRSGHSCAVVNAGTNRIEVLAIGGNDGANVLNSVEILKPGSSMEWTTGPFLPLELEHTTALSDGEEVWLIGGKTSAGKNQDLIFRLKSGKWQVQKTKLEVARSSHVALLVPNSFFRC